ncbi:unnamed protein product [Diamesa tonsa]
MSDTLEIVEITDTSIVISPELIKTNSTKRTYNEHDSEPDGIDESILKKGRVDILEELEQETSEIDVIEDESTENQQSGETLASNIDLSETDELDKNISETDLNESEPLLEQQLIEETFKENMHSQIDAHCSVDEVLLQLDDKPELLDVSNEIENEDIDDDDEIEPEQEAENDNERSSDESAEEDYSESDEDDEVLMARANLYASSPRIKQQPPKPAAIMNDEPIPLSSDDEDDNDNTNESEKHWKRTGNADNEDNDNDSSDFSVDNNPIISEDEQSLDGGVNLDEYHQKNARRFNNLNLRIRKKCIKKSLKFVVVEKMDTSEVQQPEIVLKEVEDCSQSDKIVQNINDVMLEVTENVELKINQEIIVPVEKSLIDSKPVTENTSNLLDSPRTNENTGVEMILLEDISKNSIEDLFNRFIVENQEQQSVEVRCEELSYCLQQNKIDIHKAQQLWNEKVHIKYKIRELMERLRRHRAVMEIEHFGIKPVVASDTTATNNPLISSKSSTTKSSKSTISETENFEKQLQTDSVKRLIEDVKASMLKRDSKIRMEMESDYNSYGDANNSFGANAAANNSNNLSQGRQGPIIDVQTLINDFRQKNPQEIPRRGRRMKNYYGSGGNGGGGGSSGYYGEHQQEPQSHRSGNNSFMKTTNGSNNGDYIENKPQQNRRPSYPEVSLHPVQRYYENISNMSSYSSLPPTPQAQSTSLLHGILTKPNHNFQNHAAPSTSTLARLLTAPERSLHSSRATHTPSRSSNQVKVHNNGEITITPIAIGKKEYKMDDEDNSMEPPLIIDESEDYDMLEPSSSAGQRHKTKSISDLLCQGCKKNKAGFMCAGCSRQWYCSKECQELAWDDHAEMCSV